MELEFFAMYPGVGGVSGILSINAPRAILKVLRSFCVFTSLGSRFHDFPALTEKELSKRDLANAVACLLRDGMTILMPSLELSLKTMPMSFGQIPCNVFHTWMIM